MCWLQIAESMGFKYAASGPMVRSSYRAGELYLSSLLKGAEGKMPQAQEPSQAAQVAVGAA